MEIQLSPTDHAQLDKLRLQRLATLFPELLSCKLQMNSSLNLDKRIVRISIPPDKLEGLKLIFPLIAKNLRVVCAANLVVFYSKNQKIVDSAQLLRLESNLISTAVGQSGMAAVLEREIETLVEQIDPTEFSGNVDLVQLAQAKGIPLSSLVAQAERLGVTFDLKIADQDGRLVALSMLKERILEFAKAEWAKITQSPAGKTPKTARAKAATPTKAKATKTPTRKSKAKLGAVEATIAPAESNGAAPAESTTLPKRLKGKLVISRSHARTLQSLFNSLGVKDEQMKLAIMGAIATQSETGTLYLSKLSDRFSGSAAEKEVYVSRFVTAVKRQLSEVSETK